MLWLLWGFCLLVFFLGKQSILLLHATKNKQMGGRGEEGRGRGEPTQGKPSEFAASEIIPVRTQRSTRHCCNSRGQAGHQLHGSKDVGFFGQQRLCPPQSSCDITSPGT